MATSWTAQATVTASLTAFLYEGFTYNAVYLGRILPEIGRESEVSMLLVVFNVIWGLALWSYLRVSWADPGVVPEEWHDFVKRVGVALPVAPGMKEWQPGKATMCKHCVRPRPERAHHCGFCGVCIMRLDHHCPWINNCVGFSNHKYFLLTCTYAFLACVVALVTALPALALVTQRIRFALHGIDDGYKMDPSDEIAFIIFAALAVLISLFLTPLLYYQLRLAFENKTTIEDNYNNMTNPFNMDSIFLNMTQIFGEFGPDWLLPIQPWRPAIDGITFPSAGDRSFEDRSPLTADARTDAESEESQGGKTWLKASGEQSFFGEARWRVHYHIQDIREIERKPSTMDYMLGCMHIDCDGNQRPSGYGYV